MKQKEGKSEKMMSEILAESKRLKEPLQKAQAEVAELQKQLANYQKDKQSLSVNKYHEVSYLSFGLAFWAKLKN